MERSVFNFEKLTVWQKSKEAVVAIYRVTGKKQFPEEEKFGLISQMKRSAVSISSNLAEGSTRNTAKDKSNFYTIAYDSAIELLNQAIIATELEFICEEDYLSIRDEIEEICAMISGLRRALF